MKLRILSALSLVACLSFASIAEAQEEQDRGGRRQAGGQRGGGQRGGQGGGQRGGQGGGQRGGVGQRGGFGGGQRMELGAATELMSLLRIDEVRKEVELDEETWKAISANQPDMREMFRASEDERKKMLDELNNNATAMLDEALAPSQLKRLMGLFAQQRGIAAVTNKLIAKEIGLDDKGLEKVKEAQSKSQEKLRDEMRSKMQEMFSGGERPDREKMTEMMKSMREESDKEVSKALTSDQKKKLEALKGEKFEFPEQQFGGRGFGGAGGGPGGRPQGGRGGDGEEERGGRPQRGGRPGSDR